MKTDIKKIRKLLETKVSPEYREFLSMEIPRGEALLKMVRQDAPEWGDVIRPLTKMYLEMNRQLGMVCQEIGYGPRQITWSDSQPLEILAQIFTGLELTEWYQRHLSAIMMNPLEPDHPWIRVIMIAEPPDHSQ